MGEREIRIGGKRLLKGRLDIRRRGQEPVHALHISVTRVGGVGGQVFAVTVLQHGGSFRGAARFGRAAGWRVIGIV
ncbi:MAG: hypothetical protein OXT01_05735, partial [Rhodospirillaceae bacterium]|nr:hypothetical protein [Rhodospirillaceae bacterium]